jgi:alpha-beta hydrolase superfamily lysophospholipase
MSTQGADAGQESMVQQEERREDAGQEGKARGKKGSKGGKGKKRSTVQKGKRRRLSRRAKVIMGIVAALVVACIVCQIATGAFMNQMFGREDPSSYPHMSYRYSDVESELERTPVSFESGGNTLRGYVYAPGNSRGLVVFTHGMGAGHETYINDIKQMADRGFAVLAFDCTGCGESDGAVTRGLEQAVLDLDACLDYVASDPELSQLPLILMGHSQGAYASCAVLTDDHSEVDAVISISGFDVAMDAIMGQGSWMFGGAIYLLEPFLWVDDRLEFGGAANYSAVRGLNASVNGDVPALIVHGTEDEAISYETASLNAHAEEITDAKATYVGISTEGSNGHNSILLSPAANAERDRISEEFNQLAEENGGSDKVSVEEAQRLVDSCDRVVANESNPELYAAVDEFLQDAGL